MSKPPQSVGSTLAGGIQDISAILPLIGTEQCEKHVGSALEGGYLYAAATPLSIFGSLGIVKAGISVLISSISISKISLSFRNFKFSIGFSRHSKWLGARMLNDAGFQLPGTVAPLIEMDGKRYKAESRLIQILEEKHIDNPENISIEWKSREWNMMLGLFTIVAAAMSGTPYIALLVGPWRPTTHTPWLFPILRTVGSCLATVCCQFLIQSRVISLMKNRISFMIIHRRLTNNLSRDNKVDLDHWLKQYLKWDVDIPAEQSLWSLEQFFSSGGSFRRPNGYLKGLPGHISITMERSPHFNEGFYPYQVLDPLNEHFTSSTFIVLWVILCLSLPAAVAGYIGCFTLVSTSPGNGPLIWLGLEAVLSIVRILVWAWNPDFDEGTNITVKLKLTEELPLITAKQYNPLIFHLDNTEREPFGLIPDRQFLEWITPYTGPLDRFDHSKNFAMYFTLTSGYEVSENPEKSGKEHESLLMTFVDSNKQIAATLVQVGGMFLYFDAAVTLSPTSGKMEAKLQSVISRDHSWLTENVIPFDALAQYYKSIMYAISHRRIQIQHSSDPFPPRATAELQWKWNLRTQSSNLKPIQLIDRDMSFLDLGYEHQLKTQLIDEWSRWIVEGMKSMRSYAWYDCKALADATSRKAEWELTELDSQLGWEWIRRELAVLVSSIILEDILYGRTENYIHEVAQEQKDKWLKKWIMSEFIMGRRKRWEKERGKMKKRAEKEMKGASERAEQERRPWSNQGQFKSLKSQWERGFKFVDKQWSAGIDGGHAALENVMSELDSLVKESAPNPAYLTELEKTRLEFVDQVRQRFVHWHPQHENERREMDATIKRIRNAGSQREHLDNAYKYPEPDRQATLRFVQYRDSTSKGKACSAIVYDVTGCNKEEVCDVIKKTTTRSVINVDPDIVDSIPENDHLLFLGCQYGEGEEPAFIQRNRDRWWDQQTTNSSTFYFSPLGVHMDVCYASSGPIAHIFIFLTAPSRVRLRLLHYRRGDISVSIQQDGKELRRISTEISQSLRLQDLELDKLGPGKHQLEVVVVGDSYNYGSYRLRDILIEFFNDPTLDSSADKDDVG